MRKARSLISIFFISAALFISGCSSELQYPSINYSSSREYNNGQVVWRDLVSPDPNLSSEFYKKVFGWTVKQVGTDDQPYWIFRNNGKPVAGMYKMSNSRKNAGGEWLPYFSVSSPEDFVSRSRTAGGNIILKPFELSGRGKVALLSDPENAYFAIIRSSNGDPSQSEPADNEFLWNELWSNDIVRSADYYKNIFSSQIEETNDDARPYIILKNNGKKSSGIIKNPVENVRDHWIQYVRVSDVKATEQKAKDAGARIIIPADTSIRNGTVSVMIDPAGAPLAIQKWPIE